MWPSMLHQPQLFFAPGTLIQLTSAASVQILSSLNNMGQPPGGALDALNPIALHSEGAMSSQKCLSPRSYNSFRQVLHTLGRAAKCIGLGPTLRKTAHSRLHLSKSARCQGQSGRGVPLRRPACIQGAFSQTPLQSDTMPGRMRQPGEFCWVNMLTPDPPKARAFFSDLLGWTYDELPHSMGHIIVAGGQKIGGLFDSAPGPNNPSGSSPQIGVMVRAVSTDDVSKRVAELGGTVSKPPFDVMENGRMSCCVDPTGGRFDLWQPKKQPLDEVDGTAHGAASWFELLTDDVGKAVGFYTALFGWSAEAKSMPGGFEYTICKLGGEQVAGVMPILQHMQGVKPHWAVYFAVTDVFAAEKKAVELGGKVMMPVMEVEGVGHMGGIESPQGVMFYIIQYAS
ncbi:hypothetical protein KFL_001660170 [Klebsormidium nitens]|uniref:VOC domain-containing protein n=1 Tax=Klebsormidium nitens TaxID=105231 RepID=A0A1Y1I1P7_KLENI|nr:hypothetical protein KFL_001660170 [Klebsormidium nitens]|eukprot:GAQ83882.1 hypothetical protein KFL_001660170 [Klebsormidium nitens]